MRIHWYFSLFFAVMLPLANLESCQAALPPQAAAPTAAIPVASAVSVTLPASKADLLQQSWTAYRDRFIQADGRVIDREADDRSTSEGQGYALLRAVLVDDRGTFDRVLNWAENNLQRQSEGKQTDTLWAWKWGRTSQGEWRTIDANFASDGDIDAITALIFAARRWQHPAYLELARTKLQDLWNLSTVARVQTRGFERYLLPGPAASFQQQTAVQLNPSYFAPYAFRLFAQVDPAHDWMSVVDSSYAVLQQAASLSSVGLPNDWVLLDLATGRIKPLQMQNPGTSDYGFDAYRVWWRVALDAGWFNETRARSFLQRSLKHPLQLWRSQKKIPARIDLAGKPAVNYESTAQYAMLYAALQLLDPETARQIEQQKLATRYRNGFWDGDSAYYTQNLTWLGLASPTAISGLLQSR